MMDLKDRDSDKKELRRIFDEFDAMSKQEFKTEVGQEIGRGIKEAVKIIKPYMVELSQKLK